MDLVERVKNILLQPKQEWPVIAAENTSTADLYTQYIIPLSAIPAVAGFIGMSLVGVGPYRLPAGTGLGYMITRFVLGLIAVYVLAYIIDVLAPNFGGERNLAQALKVAAYSSTAAWVAGIFMLIPPLAILGILGLYSLYLLYLGLPVLMKSPQEKAGLYTVVVVVAAIVLFLVVGIISRGFLPPPIHA